MHKTYSSLKGFSFSGFVTDGDVDLKVYILSISNGQDEFTIYGDGIDYGNSYGDGFSNKYAEEYSTLEYNDLGYNFFDTSAKTYDYCFGFADA